MDAYVFLFLGLTFLVVAGLRFDTCRYDSGPNAGESGPRWRLGPRPRERIPADAYSPTPEAAARRATELAGNWTGETVNDRYAHLARHTIGEARRLPSTSPPRPHETISADSIRQSRWRVTVAKAERRHDGWVVSRWEPQP
jgi:hypothetical protein